MADDNTAKHLDEQTSAAGANEPEDERLDESGTSAEEAVADVIEEGEDADKGRSTD